MKQPDLEKLPRPQPRVPWLQEILTCLVCWLIVGLFVWATDPNVPFEATGHAAQGFYYNLLVQGFSEGHLYVKKDAPPALAQLANPYDAIANAPYIGPFADLSYYKGRLYLYYGVTPALVLFWPYHLLTGHYLSQRIADAFLFALGCAITLGLIRSICRRHFPEINIWMMTACALVIGLTIGLTISGNYFDIARMSGFVFVMLTLAAIWRALNERPQRQALWLVMASLAYGLAVGSRPSLLFGAIALLIPMICTRQTAGENRSTLQTALLFTAAIGPITLTGLGLMLYNDLRFNNPFEFGWHYMLVRGVNQTIVHQFGLDYFWFNLRLYLSQFFRLEARFPFLHPISLLAPPGYWSKLGDVGGGILWRYPFILLVLAVPLAWKGKSAQTISFLRWFALALFLIFAANLFVLCLFCAAGISYEMDFLPALLLLLVIGFLGLENVRSTFPHRKIFLRCGVCLLLVYSLAFNALLNIETHAQIKYLAGNVFFHRNQFDQALAEYQNAAALWPNYADAHYGLANALVKEGRSKDAIIEYQKTLDIAPDYALAYGNLGNTFLVTGDADDAVVQFQKAVELEPKSVDFLCDLGNALLSQGHPDQAMVQYQKALEVQPRTAEECSELAAGLFNLGRKDDGIAQYREAVALDPTSPDYHALLANALFESGMLDEAIVQYQQAIQLQPDFTRVHLMLGMAYFKKGLLDQAIAQYQKVIELQPDIVFAYFHLGDALLKKGVLDEAIVQYQKAIQLQPNFTQAYINLGDAFLKKDLPDEAVVQYQKAIDLQPGAAPADNGLGDAFRAQGKASEAVAAYRRAIEIQPHFLKPQISVAWILSTWPDASIRQGNEAVALMEEVNQLSREKDANILRTLAAAYAETGRFPDAVATAKKALGLAGDQSDIELKNKLETEIERYKSNCPCRSTNN